MRTHADLAHSLLDHACDALAASPRTDRGFSPLVVPWTSEGPGALLVFPREDGGADAAIRRAEVEVERAAGWTGYLYARTVWYGIHPEADGAVTVTGWHGEEWVHLRRRYRSRMGGVRWVEEPVSLSEAPPNLLALSRRETSRDELEALRAAFVDFARRARGNLTGGELPAEWPELLAGVALPERAAVAEELRAWFEAKRTRLERLLGMRAPAIIVDAELEQVRVRLESIAAVGSGSTPET